MFKLTSLFRRASHTEPERSAADEPPTELVIGTSVFDLSRHLAYREGYPTLDWEVVQSWVNSLETDAMQGQAWSAAEKAWLLHMRESLGRVFELVESSNAMLLSSLEPNIARRTLDYMERTLRRVVKVLDGIALVPPLGKDLLLVFDDEESYYRYVSCYYPEAGEFAFSGGMHIDAGCSHYATVKNDLRLIEPIIAHEMTHGCLGHLPLPAWLNEGLAVNVEQRIAPTPSTHTPLQLHGKHLAFWGRREIQEFWSGKSFLRPDDGNLLSYALAQLIVEQLSRDWEPFKLFVLAADGADAGAAAAKEHLGVDLGEFVCVLLEKTTSPAWAPDSSQWDGNPERGRFSKSPAR
jgi:hypothetical protein